jgi:hypothetical protein
MWKADLQIDVLLKYLNYRGIREDLQNEVRPFFRQQGGSDCSIYAFRHLLDYDLRTRHLADLVTRNEVCSNFESYWAREGQKVKCSSGIRIADMSFFISSTLQTKLQNLNLRIHSLNKEDDGKETVQQALTRLVDSKKIFAFGLGTHALVAAKVAIPEDEDELYVFTIDSDSKEMIGKKNYLKNVYKYITSVVWLDP